MVKFRRRCSSVFIVNFKHISPFFQLFILLTLNRWTLVGLARNRLHANSIHIRKRNIAAVHVAFGTDHKDLLLVAGGSVPSQTK